MDAPQPSQSSPPVLSYQTRHSRPPVWPRLARPLAGLVMLLQRVSLFGLILWSLFFVGPSIPKVIGFSPAPLVGSSLPAVAKLSNQEPFPSEHISALSQFLDAFGGTILSGPASGPLPAPDTLEVLAIRPGHSDGLTDIELPLGLITVGQGHITYRPRTGDWHLKHVYDVDQCRKHGHFRGAVDTDFSVFYGNLPPGIIEAHSSTERPTFPGRGFRGKCTITDASLRPWQAPLSLRIALPLLALIGFILMLGRLHSAASPRHDRLLLIWSVPMLLAAGLGLHFIRPLGDFFVLPWSNPPVIHWHPAVLIPSTCALLLAAGAAQRLLKRQTRA